MADSGDSLSGNHLGDANPCGHYSGGVCALPNHLQQG